MTHFRLGSVTALFLLWGLASCGSSIDPAVRPYIGPKKDVKLFLSKSVDEQIQIYLKVAALPGHPADYSLGKLIAISDGDIGRELENRLKEEKDYGRLSDLIRLGGDYCNLNKNCKGEEYLRVAAESAAEHLPKSYRNFADQSLSWIKQGVAGNLVGPY